MSYIVLGKSKTEICIVTNITKYYCAYKIYHSRLVLIAYAVKILVSCISVHLQ